MIHGQTNIKFTEYKLPSIDIQCPASGNYFVIIGLLAMQQIML